MKTCKQLILSLAITFAIFTHAPAIEGLKLRIRCPDVVLLWPSLDGETYIVQYRATIDTNSSWVTLTNSLPAESGTNITTFIHSNRVDCPVGQIFGMMSASGSGGGPMLSMAVAALSVEDRQVLAQAREVTRLKELYSLCKLEEREPYLWELEDRPPYPWEAQAPLVSLTKDIALTTGASWSGGLDGPSGSPPVGPLDGPVPNPTPSTGFYEVVRVGPHFFGLTNGMVLSGVVSLPMEFGNTNTTASLDTLFLFAPNGGPVPNGFTFPDIPGGITYGMTSRWDTTVVPNGTYTFGVGAYLNDYVYSQYGMSMTDYEDNMVTVQVSNLISWDGYGVGGDAFYVGAKTIYPNGKWQLNIYDNLNRLLATLPSTTQQGPIDANGYCAWPDPNNPNQPDPNATFPGFSLSNLDPNGNRLPYPSYALAMSIWPFGGGSSKASTNIVAIEASWPEWPSTTVVAYQQLFAYASLAYDEEMAMVQAVAAAQNIYHPLVNLPLFNNLDLPFEITMGGGWSSVTNALATAGTRDFFWFGHGSPRSLGGGGLRATTVAALLGNNAVTTNSHPYRFVFLDGCLTANGDFPQAFGIPKIENMTGDDFTKKRGIRQRAFMGWDQTKIVGALGAYWNPSHSSLIDGFYVNWQTRNPTTGYGLNGVKTAFDNAKATNSMSGGMHIYGSKELIIDF